MDTDDAKVTHDTKSGEGVGRWQMWLCAWLSSSCLSLKSFSSDPPQLIRLAGDLNEDRGLVVLDGIVKELLQSGYRNVGCRIGLVGKMSARGSNSLWMLFF